ncbi:MAG TPA: rhomboid family intramembrane serine protease [Chitinophagaceae bacterium]|nr:rhomboid family intramembrane serine protease [Chitinophagaceae bacterium]
MKVAVKYERRKIFFGENNNIIWRLIIANAVVFTALFIVQILFLVTGQADKDFTKDIYPWAVMPSGLQMWLTRPWTLISFMFVHEGFIELLTHMLWLWGFGTLLQEFAGPRKVLPLYLYGGLAGAVFFMAFHYANPAFRAMPAGIPLFGSGPSIMAITLAVTVLVPKYRIFPMLGGGIPLWVITAIFLVVDIAGASTVLLSADFGGALMGLAFGSQLKKGNDWSGWAVRLMDRFDQAFDPEKKSKQTARPSRIRKFYKQDAPPFRRIGAVPEKKIDELLDKINQEGYDSLTQDEKDILMRASHQDE